MANYEKRQCDGGVFVGHRSPHKVLDHAVVLILASTVVSMEVCNLLSQSMVLQEVVNSADNGIGSLTTVSSLISQEVDLPRNGFTVHSKHCALSRCEKVDWTWLKWIRGVVHLLGVIKGIVHFDVLRVTWDSGAWWWWCEVTISKEVGLNTLLAFPAHSLVVRSLHLDYP